MFLSVFLTGFLIPEPMVIPVKGADRNDWNPHSFWFHPWGKSGTHKGIDIFAQKGTPVICSVPGLAVPCSRKGRGGNTVLVLGPKWRFHYYAHLDRVQVRPLHFVRAGKVLGTVGNSGNAKGKPPHLHYAIFSTIPYPWRWHAGPQGWKQMFFLNPQEALTQ